MRTLAVIVVTLVASVVLASHAGPARASGEPRVVVTIKPIHSLVAGVLDGIAKPSVLIQGTASPHTFSLKPSDAAAINSANVFVRVSEELEPFTRRLIGALPKSVEVMTMAESEGLELLPIRSGGTFESDNHAGHGHGHGKRKGKATAEETDGHIWLDPRNAKAITARLAKSFAKRWPEHAARIETNAAALTKRLDDLDRELVRDLEPVKGRPFIVFHDAYQYFERRYGLSAAGSITVNPEVQPSGKRLLEFRRKLLGLKATCVMSEPQFEPKVVQTLITGTDARTGVLDPLGAGLDAGVEHYFGVLRGLAKSLKACVAPAS